MFIVFRNMIKTLIYRFNQYLKLFIMAFIIMGIKWCITILYNFHKLIYQYTQYEVEIYLYFNYSTDILLNLSIFITFVCKKKIKQLLLKQFGWKQKCNLLPEIRHEANVTFSNTCTTISKSISMEKLSSSGKTNFYEIHSTELIVTKL